MAKFNQGDAVFSFDNAADALQDVSADIQSVTIDLTVNGNLFHTLGSDWAEASEGNKQATVTINFYDNTTATTFAGYLRAWALQTSTKGGARSLRIQTPDGTAGSLQYDMEVKLGGSLQLANLSAGGGDPHALSVTLNVDGEITDTVIT